MNEYESQKARERATMGLFGTLVVGGAKLLFDHYASQELQNLSLERSEKQRRYDELNNKKWAWLLRSQEEADEMNRLSKEIASLDQQIENKRKK